MRPVISVAAKRAQLAALRRDLAHGGANCFCHWNFWRSNEHWR
jgi:hypothetical protein